MESLFDLKGKRAIVTGASRGLGKEMAQALHNAGVELIIMGTNEKVMRVAEELSVPEASVQGVIADFKNRESIYAAFEEAINCLGDLDILVNNAGMQIRNPSLEFSVEDWETILQVNLTSAFILSQLAGKRMIEKGYGKIINIASLLSFSGGLYVPAYAASKGGVAQMTKALANEWASKGVNVNAIAPGYMDTDNISALKADPERRRQILERIPAGRFGLPQEITGALLFLASHASDYVHGSIITVDGGWMSR